MALLGVSVRCLSRGVTANVYELTRARETVALKVLHARERGTEARRFAREVEALARLRHPNVVRIERVLADASGPRALVMPRLRGETLAERIARSGPLPSVEAGPLFRGLLDGLSALHGLGIVHRDVKPANVFLGREHSEPAPEDRAILLDLGSIKTSAPSLTAEGWFVGSTRYAAPEQILGGAVDARTDVFSVGLTLCEALSGSPVRAIADPSEALREDALDLAVRSLAGSPLGRVAACAIRPRPRDRFPDAASMSHAIGSALGGGDS